MRSKAEIEKDAPIKPPFHPQEMPGVYDNWELLCLNNVQKLLSLTLEVLVDMRDLLEAPKAKRKKRSKKPKRD